MTLFVQLFWITRWAMVKITLSEHMKAKKLVIPFKTGYSLIYISSSHYPKNESGSHNKSIESPTLAPFLKL